MEQDRNAEELNFYYRQLKNIQSQIPLSKDEPFLPKSIVDSFHRILGDIQESVGYDCTEFLVRESDWWSVNDGSYYKCLPVRTQLGNAIGYLEAALGIDDREPNQYLSKNQITVVNQNTIALNIQQTINDLINVAKTDEEKEKLSELKDELGKEKKDWNKIKSILIWVLNFSKELFFRLLPDLLKHYQG